MSRISIQVWGTFLVVCAAFIGYVIGYDHGAANCSTRPLIHYALPIVTDCQRGAGGSAMAIGAGSTAIGGAGGGCPDAQ